MRMITPTLEHLMVRRGFGNPRLALRGLVSTAAAAALLLLTSPPVRARGEGNPNPRVHPPNSQPYGNSYGEWAAVYWQWLLSFPANASPSFEQGDVVYGSQKQSGPVWILETGNSGVWDRNVRVPAGKGLLFSITGAEADTLAVPGTTAQDLLDMNTAPFNELTVSTLAEVDGVPLQNVDQYLSTSPVFGIAVPEPGGLFGEPSGTGEAMAKGWFFVLAPLSKGQHTVRVAYHIVELPELDGDTTYQITIE